MLAKDHLLFMVFFQYHSLISFSLCAIGLVFFVITLQEGFYAYQFRTLGWTMMSIIAIVTGCHGLLVALW